MATQSGAQGQQRLRRPNLIWAPGVRAAEVRKRVADVWEGLAALVLVAVVAGFLAHGGARALASNAPGGSLVGIARLSGLVATYLLLVQLLLIARLPWIDRLYGHDRATVAHRWLGRVVWPLLAVHAGSVLLGFAAQTGRSTWLEPWLILGQAPDMLTAYAALTLLTVVMVTSIRKARRRLRYESWHALHLMAYAAVVLAIPHQLAAGTDFSIHPVMRMLWILLYVTAATALIVFRVAVPLARSWRHRLVVDRVVDEGGGAVSVYVGGRDLADLPAKPGQFLQWRFLAPSHWASAHPYSLSAAPDGRHLRLTARELGDHSASLRRLRPGTRVIVEGPYGVFTADRRTRNRVLLIAAGIGVTPVRALAEQLSRRASVTLVYRSSSDDDVILRDELEQLVERAGLTLHVLTGARGPGGSWLPAGYGPDGALALQALVPRLREHEVYICGPSRWIDRVVDSVRRAGVARKQVHFERFAW